MTFKIIFIVLIGLSVCLEIPPAEIAAEFGEFLKKFEKKYDSIEETIKRYNIFAENYKYIKEHNAKKLDFTLGINQFADLTLAEVKATYLLKGKPTNTPCTLKHVKGEANPLIDWKAKGMVSQMKNQGRCGSCWAFAAIGAVESLHAIKKGLPLIEYSVQEIVDCTRGYGDNEGCNGGWPEHSFEYMKDHGISTEQEYPYRARNMYCRKKSNSFQISGCVNVTSNDSDELLEALNLGPVSILVRSDNKEFLNYHSGVITEGCGKPTDDLDHAILLVGAGIHPESNIPFWLVKNSWGTWWGDDGYGRIKRSTGKGESLCGIAMQASYPVA